MVDVYTPIMRRIQIHIDEDVDDALTVEAARLGRSKASLIREFIARGLPHGSAPVDPGTAFIAAYAGSPDDSESVDDVVYGR